MKRILLALMFGLVMVSCGGSEATQEAEEAVDSTKVDSWGPITETSDSTKIADSTMAASEWN